MSATTSNPNEPTSVQKWIAGAQCGTPPDLGQRLEACRGYLRRIVQGELPRELQAKVSPSDFVQDALFEAHRDQDQLEGRDDRQVRAWLRRILLNNLSNFIRGFLGTSKRDVSREVPLGGTDSRSGVVALLDDGGTSPSNGAARNELHGLLGQALECLEERDRRVLVWHLFELQSFEEISVRLGCSKTTVSNRYHKALGRLQEAFRDLSAA